MPPRVPPAWARVSLYVALTLAAWAYCAHEWHSVRRFVRETDHCRLLFCDFVNHYYPQAQEIVGATQPVDGFMYSATFGWVLAPIGRLPPDDALRVWGVIQGLLTFVLIVPLSWLFLAGAERFWWRFGYAAVCLTSIPLFHNFKWGQVSVLLTACVIAAPFVRPSRAGSVIAGFLMAFATAVKFYPAVFFLILLFRKEWLALVAAVTLVVVLLALPMWPMGYEHYRSFSTARLAPLVEKEVLDDPNSQYIGRVLPADFPSTFRAPRDLPALKLAGRAVAVLNIVLAFAAGWLRIPEDSKRRLSLCLLFLMLPFVVTTSWMHYLVYLPFCQVCLPYEAARTARRDRWWPTATVYVLTSFSAVLSSVPFVRARLNWAAYVTPGFGFYANAFALLAASVMVLTLLRAPETTPIRTLQARSAASV